MFGELFLEKLFKILNIKKDEIFDEYIIELSHKEHPFFKAHFPKNEILAAFLQIDIIANILKHKIKKIEKAKFLSIIKPNEIIKYYIYKQDTKKYKVVIKNLDNKKISEFVYEA